MCPKFGREFGKYLRNWRHLGDAQPVSLSLEDVNHILATVRPDFRNYIVTRFFTAMRSGDINGLQWKYVDLDHTLIMIRESFPGGEVKGIAKNTFSIRDVPIVSRIIYPSEDVIPSTVK